MGQILLWGQLCLPCGPCSGCPCTSCQGANNEAAADGVRVSPVSWPVISTCPQQVRQLTGGHKSYSGHGLVQYGESIPKRWAAASVFVQHGAALLCLPPHCRCNTSLYCLIAIQDVVREDSWAVTEMQWDFPPNKRVYEDRSGNIYLSKNKVQIPQFYALPPHMNVPEFEAGFTIL